MKNPYTILGVSQDATNQDIIRAVAMAMRKREYSTREIAEARTICQSLQQDWLQISRCPYFLHVKRLLQ